MIWQLLAAWVAVAAALATAWAVLGYRAKSRR